MAALAVLVLVLAVAGCGSSSSSSSSTASSTAAAAAGGSSSSSSTSASSGSGSSCVATASADVKKYEAQLPVKLPSTKLDVSKLKGKTIWLIQNTSTPFLIEASDGMVAAAKALGINVKTINGQGVTQQIIAAVSQAVTQHADGIVLFAIPLNLVGAQITQAKAAGIPVVDTYNANQSENDTAKGVFGHVTPDYQAAGTLIANWIMSTSNCHVHVGMLGNNEISSFLAADGAATKTFKAQCPTACKQTFETLDMTNLSTAAGPQAVNLLRSNPDMKYLYPTFDGAVNFVLSSLKGAGLGSGLSMISFDTTAPSLALIRSGSSPLKAEVAPPFPNAYEGYTFLDQIMRGMLHMSPANWALPIRLIDSTNIGKADGDVFPGYANTLPAFLKAWGVSG